VIKDSLIRVKSKFTNTIITKILHITVFTFFVNDMTTTKSYLIRLWNCARYINCV